jgi:hypothetical protein
LEWPQRPQWFFTGTVTSSVNGFRQYSVTCRVVVTGRQTVNGWQTKVVSLTGRQTVMQRVCMTVSKTGLQAVRG